MPGSQPPHNGPPHDGPPHDGPPHDGPPHDGRPVPDGQFERWRRVRADQLRQLPWLRTDTGRGLPARYVADELLVRADQHGVATQVLGSLGHRPDQVTEHAVPAGFRRLRVPGLDVPDAVRRIRDRAGAVAGPNHVFLSAPFEHGGPHGAPVPTAAPTNGLDAPTSQGGVQVSVLDTAVWSDSPLPTGWYQAGPADMGGSVDADLDGLVDSDVGHANFITGVVLRRTTNASVRIVKVLDTFGVCTEADLANALLGLCNVDVVNLSLGGFTADDQPPLVLQEALSTLLQGQDRVAVAAAGNDGETDRPFWPAAFAGNTVPWQDQMVAVTAHDGQQVCSWSNTGSWITLAALGEDITSTYIVNYPSFASGWARWSGTSFATPHVVAAIAARVPDAGSVREALRETLEAAAGNSFGPYPGLP
jgi:hypothetical protein